MPDRGWCVMRQDDNGNRYLVAAQLPEDEARRLAASYAARGHKQLYWVEPDDDVALPAPATAR